MKRLILTAGIISFLLIFSSYSEANELKFFAGPSFSKIGSNSREDFILPELKYKTFFHAGFSYNIEIGKYFSVEPGLMYGSKGVKYKSVVVDMEFEDDGEYLYETLLLRLNYLEVPVMLRGVLPLKNDKKIFVGIGPYLGVAFYNNAVSRMKWIEYEKKIELTIGKNGMKRIDMGLKSEIGFQYKNYFTRLFYDQGFINIGTDNELGNKILNHTIGLSVGYAFSFKKKDPVPPGQSINR